MTDLSTVTRFPKDFTNIAAELRKLADWIDTRDAEVFSCVVLLGTPAEFNVYAHGIRVTSLEVLGWLSRAVAEVGSGALGIHYRGSNDAA